MGDLILSYFVYNMVVGAALVIYYFFTGNRELKAKQIIWLLIFPAAGLGKWRFIQDSQRLGVTEFPEQWYLWKYMIKVNWGYMALLGFLPVIMLLAALIGLSVAGMPEFDAFTEMESLIGAGVFLMIVLGLIVIVFLLIIPFLILIYFPMYQKRKVEQDTYYRVLNARLAGRTETSTVTPAATANRSRASLLPVLESYVLERLNEFGQIPKHRKNELEELAQIIKTKLKGSELVNLNFICTHNSRRSQFGQVWAAVAAGYYGIRNIQTYSGGTEATAFNKRAVAAIERAGLAVKGTVGTNPRYSVRFSDEMGALDCYSKTFDDPANPQKGFIAVMTCSDADENCPVILGAEHRVKLMYDDPKIADGTSSETKLYDERCAQIASEMLYLFSKV